MPPTLAWLWITTTGHCKPLIGVENSVFQAYDGLDENLVSVAVVQHRPRGLASAPNAMQQLRLALKPHVILEREADDDDVVLIDSRTGRMTACNETASAVIVQLQTGCTIARLVEVLVKKFRVADDIATRDVNALLDMLAAEGLLQTPE